MYTHNVNVCRRNLPDVIDERYRGLIAIRAFSLSFPRRSEVSAVATAFKAAFLSSIAGAEGAFKKLKPDPCASSPHIGHTPTTASCPTPARRRHRTTFTQVCMRLTKHSLVSFFFFRLMTRDVPKTSSKRHILAQLRFGITKKILTSFIIWITRI